MSNDAIQISPIDNVATALIDLPKDREVRIGGSSKVPNIVTAEPIRAGHKLAVQKIEKGAAVTKYGEIIGTATMDIQVGSHVHIHNVEGRRGRGDLK
jgi:altronate dehydratase